MENKIVYVVGYGQGCDDDHVKVTLFVTTDEQKAINWCKKWDNLYERLGKYYINTCRRNYELGESFYYETELR